MNPSGLPLLLRHHTGALIDALPRARAGHVRSVHRARVASRRLREALPVAAGDARTGLALARRELRRVTTALGDVREMDVALLTFDEEAHVHGWPLGVARRVRAHLEQERVRRDARMHQRLDRLDLELLEVELGALSAELERSAARAWLRRLSARLRRRARGLARALRGVGTLYAAEPLHGVRIAAKKLRYTLELAERAADAPAGADIAALQRVQNLLGRLHDLQILQAQVQALAAQSAADRRFARALDAVAQAFETDCRGRHAEFLRHRDGLASLAARVGRDAAVWFDARRPPLARMRAPLLRRRTASA